MPAWCRCHCCWAAHRGATPGPGQYLGSIPLGRMRKTWQAGASARHLYAPQGTAPTSGLCCSAGHRDKDRSTDQDKLQHLCSQGRFPLTAQCFDLPPRWRQKAKFIYINSGPLITEIFCPFSRHEHPGLSLQKSTSPYADPHWLHHSGCNPHIQPMQKARDWCAPWGQWACSSLKPPERPPRGGCKI